MSTVDVDEAVSSDQKAGWSSYCRRGAHESCATAGARCTDPCHGARGQQPPAPTPQRKEPTVASPGTQTPPHLGKGLQCSECARDDFLTPHAMAVHMARTHKIQGASKGPKAGKPGRPMKAPAPAKFDPPAEDLDLDALAKPRRVGGLVVKRETPAGPELRLLVDVAQDVVDLLEWLGVATMVVDLAGLEAT